MIRYKPGLGDGVERAQGRPARPAPSDVRRRAVTLVLAIGLALVLAACSPTANDTKSATAGLPNIRQQLTANVWVLDEEASSLQRSNGDRVTVAFSTAGVVSGMTACNRYTGNYTLNWDTIRVTHISQTTRTCSSEQTGAESEYLLALRAVRHVEPSSIDRLKLTGGANLRLTYVAAKSS
jgi:heat shock protein HslJ